MLAERGEELQDALAYNRLKETLTDAERLLPEAPQEIVQLLARRLLRAKYEANLAEFRALRGEPLPRVAASTTVPDVPPQESPPLSAMVSDYTEFKRAGRKWTRKTKLQHLNAPKIAPTRTTSVSTAIRVILSGRFTRPLGAKESPRRDSRATVPRCS